MTILSQHHSRRIFSLVLLAGLWLAPIAAFAAVMQSSNYRMAADSLNMAGTFATSTNYRAQDTLGELATGMGTSTSYRLSAGYQQVDAVTISITAPTAITLTPLSLTQQSAVGTGAWTVTTNDYNGYTLVLHAAQLNALAASSTAYFTDYGTSSPTTWSVSSAYKFGFSAYGSATTGFGSGGTCTASTDVPSTTLLWRGFYGTTDIQIASSSSATAQAGVATTMCVADAQSTIFAPSGNYSTTITATATAL